MCEDHDKPGTQPADDTEQTPTTDETGTETGGN